jgi:hypothetical protein
LRIDPARITTIERNDAHTITAMEAPALELRAAIHYAPRQDHCRNGDVRRGVRRDVVCLGTGAPGDRTSFIMRISGASGEKPRLEEPS